MLTPGSGAPLDGEDLPSIRDRIAEGLPVRPEAVRHRWLLAADRWRTGDLRRRSAAEHVYRSLARDLDASDAGGRDRVTWLLRSATVLDEQLYEIALRFESPSHGIDRHLARLTAAQCLATMGRLDEAMQLTELLLDEHFEAGTPHELNVLALFVVLLGWQRREIEMFAASQALERRMTELEVSDVSLRLMVQQKLSLARNVLELSVAELRKDCAELLRLAEEAPESVDWRARTWVEGALAEIDASRPLKKSFRSRALFQQPARVGSSIGARIHLANLEALAFEGAAKPWSFADLAPTMGWVALLEGFPERAMQFVEKARASTDRSRRPHTQSRLDLLALECSLALDDSGAIEREIGSLLRGLDPATSSCGECTGVLWRTGLQLARLLRSHGTREDGAREEVAAIALSRASDALLLRVEEIGRVASAYPSMFEVEAPEVLAFRQRFHEEYPELIEPLRTAIAERGREWPRLFDPHGQLQVCAWCLRARDDQGAWIPVGHLMPSNEQISVSHGICDRCAADQLTGRAPS